MINVQMVNIVWMDGPLEDSIRVSTIGYLVRADDCDYTVVPEIALPDMEIGGDLMYCEDDEITIPRSAILEQWVLAKSKEESIL